jgi:hypothetical protein
LTHYKSIFPQKANSRLFIIEENFDQWKAKLESITNEIKKLVKSTNVKIISVSEKSPQMLQKNETFLGDLPTNIEAIVEGTTTHLLLPKFGDLNERGFQDMCRWLESILGELLSRDEDWSMIVFPLGLEQRHSSFDGIRGPRIGADNPLLPELIRLNSGKEDSGSWVHFPANNEYWMTVSKTCSICYLRLTEALGNNSDNLPPGICSGHCS